MGLINFFPFSCFEGGYYLKYEEQDTPRVWRMEALKAYRPNEDGQTE